MSDLQLIKSENFGAVECDFYRKDDEICMTRKQIGEALGYNKPQLAIDKIHLHHADRLNKFSVTTYLVATDGKQYSTTLYTRKGIMEICRWSQQPKADAFMDWVWDIMDDLVSGDAQLVTPNQLSPNELILKMAQSNVEMEKRVGLLEQRNEELCNKVDMALTVFASPNKDHWKTDTEDAIKAIVDQNGFSPVKFRGQIYKELEQSSNCLLQSRLSRMRARVRKQGGTRKEAMALTKLDAISKDKQLRAIFEGIIKKYQALSVRKIS